MDCGSSCRESRTRESVGASRMGGRAGIAPRQLRAAWEAATMLDAAVGYVGEGVEWCECGIMVRGYVASDLSNRAKEQLV